MITRQRIRPRPGTGTGRVRLGPARPALVGTRGGASGGAALHDDLPDRRRPGEQVALGQLDAERGEDPLLLDRLDALGDEVAVREAGVMDHAGDERLPGGVAVDPADDPAVQLHDVRPELDEVAQARESRAGVVDGERHAGTQRLDREAQPLVVVDGQVLGELDRDRSLNCLQDPLQAAREKERRRGIERQPRPGRELLAGRDRGLQARSLEVDPAAERRRLGEPDVGATPSSNRVRAS